MRMITRHLSRAAALCVVATLAVAPSESSAAIGRQKSSTIVVRNDEGGVLPTRIREIADLRARGQRVELRGRYCLSACTLYIGLPGVCVSPGTRFGFHGPSLYGRPLGRKAFEKWSRAMAAHYPAPVRDWFLREARYELTGFINLSGRDLIRMGVRQC